MKSNSKKFYGCSQGRLIKPYNGELQCFPKNKWKEEFNLAKDCGLSYIELLAEEVHNFDNPIWSRNGINNLNSIIKKNNLIPYSICFDFAINNSIFDLNNYSKNQNYIKNFVMAVHKINIKLIILPLLKKSNFESYERGMVIKILKTILDECRSLNIEIAIESISDSINICDLLESLNDSNIGCVYDTGNRFSIGNPKEEILKLSKHIKHIHLKDKRNSLNVPIGTGEVDFIEIFESLKTIKYERYFNFETNRGNDPISTMKHNIKYIEFIRDQINF